MFQVCILKVFLTRQATLSREMYSTPLATLYHSDVFIHDILAQNDSFTCANIIFNVSKSKYGTFENFVSGPFLAGNSKFWIVESQIVQFRQLCILSMWFLPIIIVSRFENSSFELIVLRPHFGAKFKEKKGKKLIRYRISHLHHYRIFAKRLQKRKNNIAVGGIRTRNPLHERRTPDHSVTPVPDFRRSAAAVSARFLQRLSTDPDDSCRIRQPRIWGSKEIFLFRDILYVAGVIEAQSWPVPEKSGFSGFSPGM